MTHDFTPPGGSGTPGGNRPDAPVTSRTGSSQPGVANARVGAKKATNMFHAGGRVALAAWIAIAAGVALLIGISWSAALAMADDTLNYATLGETGPMSAARVVQGMCLSNVGADGNVDDVEVVNCDQPHRAEIFTKMTFDLARHPGVDEVNSQALDYCGDRLEGLLPEGASWVTWTPSQQSWARGDRVALCIAVFDEPISEPLSPAGIDGLETADPNRDSLDA